MPAVATRIDTRSVGSREAVGNRARLPLLRRSRHAREPPSARLQRRDSLPTERRAAGRPPPTCWIWGKINRLLPYEVGKKQLDILRPEEVHVIEGRGYAVAWDDPDEINTIIERFLDRYPRERGGLPAFAPVAVP